MNRAYRSAAQTKRTRLATSMPKYWLPKLDADQQLDAKVIHWDLIDRFTSGTATVVDLWDWIETGFTYSQIMRLLKQDGTEFTGEAQLAIAEQLDSYLPIIKRYKTMGGIGLNGPQLNIARAAAHVFDSLIELDRHGVAVRAALWSCEQLAKIKREFAQ